MRLRLAVLVSVGTLSSLCAIAPADAAPAAAHSRAAVERALAGVEHAPTRAEIVRLGAGATKILLQIAADPQVSRLRRNRAIAALRHLPSAAAHDFLGRVLADKGVATEGADVLDLAAALGALVPYGRDALPQLSRFLDHPSADVRQSAVVALGQLGPAGGPVLRALTERLAEEQDSGVRAALERALAALRPR